MMTQGFSRYGEVKKVHLDLGFVILLFDVGTLLHVVYLVVFNYGALVLW